MPEHQVRYGMPVRYGGVNMVVGLKSVGQLSLDVHFSDIRGMTEVYNVEITGNPDDHKDIPGND